jgi:hypothetical protein
VLQNVTKRVCGKLNVAKSGAQGCDVLRLDAVLNNIMRKNIIIINSIIKRGASCCDARRMRGGGCVHLGKGEGSVHDASVADDEVEGGVRVRGSEG